ncbi:MAG: CBS domain-containing protein [Anaerolineales bacterium]|nr:MAG: CBS domain-containing protein [Anaerolineales bacterium]
MKVRTILATKGTKVITIHPEQSLEEAARLMAEHNIGALVVVDEAGHPVGIVSERDIVRAVAKGILSGLVSQLMTKDVIIGLPQDDLISVAHTMTEKRFRHLPIMEHGALVGIVSIRDVVESQRDQYQGEIDTLQTQIIADDA